MNYQRIIQRQLRDMGRTDIHASTVEAYLRLEYGTLDYLPVNELQRAVPDIVQTIDLDPTSARELADSYGL